MGRWKRPSLTGDLEQDQMLVWYKCLFPFLLSDVALREMLKHHNHLALKTLILLRIPEAGMRILTYENTDYLERLAMEDHQYV